MVAGYYYFRFRSYVHVEKLFSRAIPSTDIERLNNDPVLCGKTAEIVCLAALKVINDVNFKMLLLEICAKYKFTKGLQKKIYRQVIFLHSRLSSVFLSQTLVRILFFVACLNIFSYFLRCNCKFVILSTCFFTLLVRYSYQRFDSVIRCVMLR